MLVHICELRVFLLPKYIKVYLKNYKLNVVLANLLLFLTDPLSTTRMNIMNLRRLIIGVVAVGMGAASVGSVHAEIYKKIMPDGSVMFTDEPSEGAQTLNIEPVPTISFPSGKAKPAAVNPAKPGKGADENKAPAVFSSFVITQPTHDSSVRANNGSVPVSIEIEPPLDPSKGQKITLILDGKPTGAPSSQTFFTLEGIERGSHTIGAEVRDARGSVVATANPVLFHLLRNTILK